MKLAEYNTVKGQLAALSRKQGGSLAVRDLSDVVQKVRLVDSENLTTLLVAVPKHQAGDWFGQYERMAQYVVPRSSRMVLEEGDFQLFTVTLFKRVVDAFKTAAREKGFQVGADGARGGTLPAPRSRWGWTPLGGWRKHTPGAAALLGVLARPRVLWGV